MNKFYFYAKIIYNKQNTNKINHSKGEVHLIT